jgi:prepilin-type N-terminal cleavage/methylation domain-containing protein
MKYNVLRRKSGFTLLELIVVVAIIAILVAIVVVAINPVRLIGEANDAKKREELNQLKNALQLYYNDNNSYPADENDLVPNYTRALPDDYAYDTASPVTSGEYRAGVALDYAGADDAETKTACVEATLTGLGTVDYVICPD